MSIYIKNTEKLIELIEKGDIKKLDQVNKSFYITREISFETSIQKVNEKFSFIKITCEVNELKNDKTFMLDAAKWTSVFEFDNFYRIIKEQIFAEIVSYICKYDNKEEVVAPQSETTEDAVEICEVNDKNTPSILSNVTDFDDKAMDKEDTNKVTEEQIKYMKDFKANHCANNNESLNLYIKEWLSETPYKINTQKELVQAGAFILEEFITWSKKLKTDSFNVPI